MNLSCTVSSVEAGITTSISKFPRQCKLWKKKERSESFAASHFVCIHVKFLLEEIPIFFGQNFLICEVFDEHYWRERRLRVSARIRYIGLCPRL